MCLCVPACVKGKGALPEGGGLLIVWRRLSHFNTVGRKVKTDMNDI